MADSSKMVKKESIVRPQHISDKLKMYIDLQDRLDSLKKEIDGLLNHQETIRTEIAAHVNPGVYRISVGNKLAVVKTTSNSGDISLVDIDYIHDESSGENNV